MWMPSTLAASWSLPITHLVRWRTAGRTLSRHARLATVESVSLQTGRLRKAKSFFSTTDSPMRSLKSYPGWPISLRSTSLLTSYHSNQIMLRYKSLSLRRDILSPALRQPPPLPSCISASSFPPMRSKTTRKMLTLSCKRMTKKKKSPFRQRRRLRRDD